MCITDMNQKQLREGVISALYADVNAVMVYEACENSTVCISHAQRVCCLCSVVLPQHSNRVLTGSGAVLCSWHSCLRSSKIWSELSSICGNSLQMFLSSALMVSDGGRLDFKQPLLFYLPEGFMKCLRK